MAALIISAALPCFFLLMFKKLWSSFSREACSQSYVYRHRRKSSQPAILQGAAAFGGYLGHVVCSLHSKLLIKMFPNILLPRRVVHL